MYGVSYNSFNFEQYYLLVWQILCRTVQVKEGEVNLFWTAALHPRDCLQLNHWNSATIGLRFSQPSTVPASFRKYQVQSEQPKRVLD